MRKETYERIFAGIQSKKYGVAAVCITGKVLTYVTAFCYFAAVVHSLLWVSQRQAAVLVLVPAVSFFAVTIFRRCCNARRPYEVYGFAPLMVKDTQGKSFPSRHVFSIFVIGSALFWRYPVAGIFICLMGCVLALVRVIAGVHFPRDVLAGGVIGIACGCLSVVLY